MNSKVKIELLPDGRQGRLVEFLNIRDADGQWHYVPEGFVTDFASVPRLFWRLIPPWGEYSPAAIVHDFLYRNGIGSRARADWVFLSVMKAIGISGWQRWLMWAAVRLFGAFAWRGSRM